MRLTTRKLLVFFLLFLVPFAWVCISWNYDYSTLAGSYRISNAEQGCALRLNEDRTFVETVTTSKATRTSHVSWHLDGGRDVLFSYDFLPLVGQEDSIHGHFGKSFGLWPYLVLPSSHTPLVLRRRVF